MGTPNQQIGWSQEAKLMQQLSKQIDKLICVFCNAAPTTTTTTSSTSTSTTTTSSTSSTTTTSTTAGPTPFAFSSSSTGSGGPCVGEEPPVMRWATASPPIIGSFIYQNFAMTIPVADGWYVNSTGDTSYEVSGGLGQVVNTQSCT